MRPVLVLLSISTVLPASCYGQCIEGLPQFRDQGPRSSAISLGDAQAIIPTYKFSCRGTITQWGVSTEKRGSHLIELQVWRHTSPNVYHKVGGNRFNQGPKKRQKLMYLTPDPRDQINVEPGDFIGLYVSNDPNIYDNYKIQFEPSDTVRMLYFTSPSAATDILSSALTQTMDVALLLHVEISSQELPEVIHPSASLNANYTLTTCTSLILPTSSLPPQDPLGPQAKRTQQTTNAVIVASTAGSLLVVVLALVIVILLLFLYSRKHRGGSETSSTTTAPTITNPTYTGKCEAEQTYMEVKENPAYGQGIQSQAHEYEIPSVNLGHFCDSPDQPQGETYEIMLRQESSEYVAMDTQVAETAMDYPIYEELT